MSDKKDIPPISVRSISSVSSVGSSSIKKGNESNKKNAVLKVNQNSQVKKPLTSFSSRAHPTDELFTDEIKIDAKKAPISQQTSSTVSSATSNQLTNVTKPSEGRSGHHKPSKESHSIFLASRKKSSTNTDTSSKSSKMSSALNSLGSTDRTTPTSTARTRTSREFVVGGERMTSTGKKSITSVPAWLLSDEKEKQEQLEKGNRDHKKSSRGETDGESLSLDLQSLNMDEARPPPSTSDKRISGWLSSQQPQRMSDWHEVSVLSDKSVEKSPKTPAHLHLKHSCHQFDKNKPTTSLFSEEGEQEEESTWKDDDDLSSTLDGRTLTPQKETGRQGRLVEETQTHQRSRIDNFNSNDIRVLEKVRRKMAARTIQRWVRRHFRRKRLATAAVARMLQERQNERSGETAAFHPVQNESVRRLSSSSASQTSLSSIRTETSAVVASSSIAANQHNRDNRHDNTTTKTKHNNSNTNNNNENKSNRVKINQRANDKAVAEREVEALVREGKIRQIVKTPHSGRSASSSCSTTSKAGKSNSSNRTFVKVSTDRDLLSNPSSPKMTRHVKSKPAAATATDNEEPEVELLNVETPRVAQPTQYQQITIDEILNTIKDLESDKTRDKNNSIPVNDAASSTSNRSAPDDGWGRIVNDIDQLLNKQSHQAVAPVQERNNGLKSAASPAAPTGDLISTMDLLAQTTDTTTLASTNTAATKITGGAMTDGKMNDILSFLSRQEANDDITREIKDSESQRQQRDLANSGWKLAPSLLDNMAEDSPRDFTQESKQAVDDVTNQVLTQRLQLEEKERSIQLMRRALGQQKELTVKQVRDTQSEMEKRLTGQQKEYETTIERNYKLIDQLIEEKKELQANCDRLVTEVKSSKQKMEERIKQMEEKHTFETKRLEGKHAAAEKLRREKWEADKTKLIKEMTVRGVEAEIAGLIASHREELRRQQAGFEAELISVREQAEQHTLVQLEEQRRQLCEEREGMLERARSEATDTLEKEIARQRDEVNRQRARLRQEAAEEQDRMDKHMERQRAELNALRTHLESKEGNVADALRLEHSHELDKLKKNHQLEISQIQKEFELERTNWKETEKKKFENEFLVRERELRKQVCRERDEEIERALRRLEDETTTNQDELEKQSQSKIRRLKDKHEMELAELERSEQSAMEKFNKTKTELLELQGNHENLKVIMKQKETEIDSVKGMYEKLHTEREHVSDIIRQEFADRLVATEEENKRLKRDVSEAKAKLSQQHASHESDLQRYRQENQQDMQEVHRKVKEAINRKEEMITEIRSQCQSELLAMQEKMNVANKRSEHLETLLDQQRKQLLKLK